MWNSQVLLIVVAMIAACCSTNDSSVRQKRYINDPDFHRPEYQTADYESYKNLQPEPSYAQQNLVKKHQEIQSYLDRLLRYRENHHELTHQYDSDGRIERQLPQNDSSIGHNQIHHLYSQKPSYIWEPMKGLPNQIISQRVMQPVEFPRRNSVPTMLHPTLAIKSSPSVIDSNIHSHVDTVPQFERPLPSLSKKTTFGKHVYTGNVNQVVQHGCSPEAQNAATFLCTRLFGSLHPNCNENLFCNQQNGFPSPIDRVQTDVTDDDEEDELLEKEHNATTDGEASEEQHHQSRDESQRVEVHEKADKNVAYSGEEHDEEKYERETWFPLIWVSSRGAFRIHHKNGNWAQFGVKFGQIVPNNIKLGKHLSYSEAESNEKTSKKLSSSYRCQHWLDCVKNGKRWASLNRI